MGNIKEGRPFRVAIPGMYSDSCKAKALPYVQKRVGFRKTIRIV